MTKIRDFSPYEKNFLLKHGIDYHDLVKDDRPVEYIANLAPFKDLEIMVNSNVLIPRIETEQLADLAINFLNRQFKKSPTHVFKIIELGTGSACLALFIHRTLINKKIKHQIIATDISAQALTVARFNYQKLLSEKKIIIDPKYQLVFQKSDLFQVINKNLKFDLILANLPYIPTKAYQQLDKSVLNYEPRIALEGGADGLKYISALQKQIPEHLSAIGQIILETYYQGFIYHKKIFTHLEVKDYQGLTRFHILKLKRF